MARRAEVLAKQIALALSRARDPEEHDLTVILNNYLARGPRGGGVIEARHARRWQTMVDLLDLRFHLERETVTAPEDLGTWYMDLVGNIHRIIDVQANHVFAELDEDARRLGGGPLPEAWRDDVMRKLKSLRLQYLNEAEILRDHRELEAKMPKPTTSPATHITLHINDSSIANLNLGTQIGQIQNSVKHLHDKGLREVADAIKTLTEDIVAAASGELSDAQKQESVELVAAIGEEINKPPEERRGSVLRSVGTGLITILKNVDKLAAGYELVKVAVRTQGIELP